MKAKVLTLLPSHLWPLLCLLSTMSHSGSRSGALCPLLPWDLCTRCASAWTAPRHPSPSPPPPHFLGDFCSASERKCLFYGGSFPSVWEHVKPPGDILSQFVINFLFTINSTYYGLWWFICGIVWLIFAFNIRLGVPWAKELLCLVNSVLQVACLDYSRCSINIWRMSECWLHTHQ